MQLDRAAEPGGAVLDGARVERRGSKYRQRDLAISVEVTALVAELAAGPADVEVARPVDVQHAFGGRLAGPRERTGRRDLEAAQAHGLRCLPQAGRLIEIVDERGIRCQRP